MTTYNDARLRRANDRPTNKAGRYVLLWLQMVRRLHSSHALDYALHLCRHLGKPLVVYEGLKLNYPWASARHHTFILQGMRDNAAAAKALGVVYWPFVERPADNGHGLVKKLCADACVLVTDDYPAYIVPAQNRAVAAKVEVAVHLIDGNSFVPLSLLGPKPISAAAHLRPRIHAQFAEAWANRAAAEPEVPDAARSKLAPPFEAWDSAADIGEFVRSLPLDQAVTPVADTPGGTAAGRAALAGFVGKKLPHYADGRNAPDAPERNKSSRLSPYLHYGHIGIQDVAEVVFASIDWTPDQVNPAAKGKRDGFYSQNPSVNDYLDEAITWRDVGYQWHWAKRADGSGQQAGENKTWQGSGEVPQFNFETFDFSPGGDRTLDVVLPTWARESLRKHEADRREHLYTPEQFEAGATHDELWNAAQQELVLTGRIHNYLRMLWAKKVLEWSETPAEAYRVLEHLNNKYAIDGRDPNTYTGIHWCFGLFDRPWHPERPVYGSVRYMSSDNTAKKFKLAGYFEYVRRVTGGTPAAVAERAAGGLF